MQTDPGTLVPELRPASHRAKIGPYLTDLWGRRQYMIYVAKSQLRDQRMTTVLGNFWHLLNPILQIAVTYVIFGLVLKVNRGLDNFVAFLAVGIFAFQFTTRSTMTGARSITGNLGLMKSFAFPRAMLPTTGVITETLAYLPTILVMFGVTLVTGSDVRWTWVFVPLLGVLQVVFNLGPAFVAARATFHVRDFEQLLPFFFRLLFYASGVFFLVDQYVDSQYRWLFIGNPMYCIVALYHSAVLGLPLQDGVLWSALIWTIVFPVVGFSWFRRGEVEYGRG